jgi:glycosyltransferase involved in cell wall biosynthesis
MSRSIFLSYVIPALDEERYIGRCLEAMEAAGDPGAGYEAIVVDNGSRDSTVAVAQAHGAHVLTVPGASIARLRNRGAEVAGGSILAFIDADCEVTTASLAAVRSLFRGDSNVILGFPALPPPGSGWVATSWGLVAAWRAGTDKVDWVPGINLIVSREGFRRVGGFDENLETQEDCDFCIRGMSAGLRVIFSTDATVTNLRPPRTLQQLYRRELWHGKEVGRSFLGRIHVDVQKRRARTKLFKVMSYAVLYLLALVTLPVTAGWWILGGHVPPLALPLIPPFALVVTCTVAFWICRRKRQLHRLPGVAAVLVMYGLARAVALGRSLLRVSAT